MDFLRLAPALVATLFMGCGTGSDNYPADDALRVNQLQALGSHNSYHIEAAPAADGGLARLCLRYRRVA